MASIITIRDETTSGESTNSVILQLRSESITARELIRERVYEEVRQYNAALPTHFRGLVQPTDAESTLNGYAMKRRRKINWEAQFKRALEAFESNGFFLLVDDRHIDNLDDEIHLTPTTKVSFVKLVPLVGG
jgi:hypothetical protein